MKKLNELGKILTRQEMKSVSGGGYRPCDENTVCGPPCSGTNPNLIEVGWRCTSTGGGPNTCQPYQCGIVNPE